jgi:hypothetical protein
MLRFTSRPSWSRVLRHSVYVAVKWRASAGFPDQAKPDIDLNRKVRRLLGGAAVSVDYELPVRDDGVSLTKRGGLAPEELFLLYHRARHNREAAVTAAFNDLLRQAEEASE